MVSLMGAAYLHLPVNTCRVFTLQSLHLPSTFKFCILDSFSERREVSRSCLVVGFAFHTFVNKWNDFNTIHLSGCLMPPSPKLNQCCYLQLNRSLSLLERPGNRLATSFSLSPLFLLFPATVDCLLWVVQLLLQNRLAAMGRLSAL